MLLNTQFFTKRFPKETPNPGGWWILFKKKEGSKINYAPSPQTPELLQKTLLNNSSYPNLLPQPTQLSPSQFIFFSTNIIRFKKEINYLGRKILRHRIILQNDSWNKSIKRLAETDIKTAPREFYSTMKRLEGLGKGTSHVTKMTYGPTTANSEIEVANLMAQYVEDSFKPLEEPDFDYSVFDKLKQEWDNAQTALENSTPPPLHTHLPPDHTYANTNSLPSPILQNTLYSSLHSQRTPLTPPNTKEPCGDYPTSNYTKTKKNPCHQLHLLIFQWMRNGQNN